jgi:hypothetical protein
VIAFDPTAVRFRRHSSGAVELRANCVRLHDGKIDRDGCLTFNRLTGLFYCHWTGCHYGGKAGGYEGGPLKGAKDPPIPGGIEDVPLHAHSLFKARGLDALYIIRRYRLKWREQRLLWPAEPGYAARATVPGQEPKQLCVDGFSASAGSLIGAHLLHEGAAVAVCQGDYGAAAIPVPWVGIGIEGKFLTEAQGSRILLSKPAEVVLCGDGGEPMNCPAVLERSGIPVKRIAELPLKHGMDDIPMRLRVLLLLSAEEV